MIHKIKVRTRSRVEFQDITQLVRDVIMSSKVKGGLCLVFVPHTTAGLTINEHADPDVVTDIIDALEAMVPLNRRYQHREGNSPAHIKTSLVGSSLSILLENNELVLGTWQGIFLCEFDGPRERTVYIKVMPESA